MKDPKQTSYIMHRVAPQCGRVRSINGSLVVGLIAAFVVLVIGLASSDHPLRFINIEGLLIVLGGTIASTLIQFSIADLKSALEAFRSAIVTTPSTARERMDTLMQLSHSVKQQGILVLEEQAQDEADEFFRLGLMLVADGTALDDTKRILRTEMENSRESEWRSVQVWETMGNFAPAMGLIGTLLGLIQMLSSMADTQTMASAMAMALVATLYGTVSANLFFFPIAGKLRVISQEREICKSVTLEGLLSLSRLENPMMLEQRLQSFASAAIKG
ncbi:MAG: motility protein A [Pseudomonadota bacterium]|jgi:chemotaxis protein MotA